MSQAIWALIHAIAHDDRERYLEWFHGVHIPEKLARPGYTWAAHYEHAIAGASQRSGHVAFFGGESTRVFHDPSPAQLKSRQDALTREMMGCRIDGRSVIFTEQWCQDGTAGRCERASEVSAAVIRLTCIDAQGHDEALEAWCAQEYFAAIGGAPGCTGVRKWLASSDAPRHGVLQTFTTEASCIAANAAVQGTPRALEVAGQMREPFGAARIARRIWPASAPAAGG
jgi:hypothetical protein